NLLGIRGWQSALAKLTPFGSIQNFHATARSASTSAAITDDHSIKGRARVIGRVIRIAAKHGLYHPTCLQKSLVLWWLLARNRIFSEIRFGARKEEGELKAHAWVECCGLTLNEDQDVCRQYPVFEAVAPERCGNAKV